MGRATWLDPAVPWELRRPDLYEVTGCWACATHIDPAYINPGNTDFRRWLATYAPWKKEHSFRHDYPCPTADPGATSWETIRRWATGAAAGFDAVDRVWCRLGWVLGPDTFPAEALMVRRDLYWSAERETSYAVRVAYAHAMGAAAEAASVLAGGVEMLPPPPYAHDEQWDSIMTQEIAFDGAIGCGWCGRGVPLDSAKGRRARAARKRRAMKSRRP